MSKILAVVDVQQLFLAARDEFGALARVDYVKLMNSFRKSPADVIDAIAYIVVSPNHEDTKFIRFLKKCGYRTFRLPAGLEQNYHEGVLESTRIIPRNCTHRMTKEVQVWAAGTNYEHFIIVSGSNAFIGPIKAIHASGKTCTVMSFRSSLSPDFAKLGADDYVMMDDTFLYDEHLYKKVDLPSCEGKV
jgi:hypothetical protein